MTDFSDYSLPITDVEDHPSTNTPPKTVTPLGTSQDVTTTGASIIDRYMMPRARREIKRGKPSS